MNLPVPPVELQRRLGILKTRLPSLQRTDVNDRTVYAWERHWIDKYTVREVAADRGWSVPAVQWHLRRARRVLEAS